MITQDMINKALEFNIYNFTSIPENFLDIHFIKDVILKYKDQNIIDVVCHHPNIQKCRDDLLMFIEENFPDHSILKRFHQTDKIKKVENDKYISRMKF